MSDPVYLTVEEIRSLNEIATMLNSENWVNQPLSASVHVYDINGENVGRFEHNPSAGSYVFYPTDKSVDD